MTRQDYLSLLSGPRLANKETNGSSLALTLWMGAAQVAADIAVVAHGNASTPYFVSGSISPGVSTGIDDASLGPRTFRGRRLTDADGTLAGILASAIPSGSHERVCERDDIYFVARNGLENHVEIRSPRLSYEQARAAKRRILRIHSVMAPKPVHAFVGIAYRPSAETDEYEWRSTRRFLDRGNEVKVAPDFWNYVGASADVYDQLVACCLEVVAYRQPELRRLLLDAK